MEKATNNYVKKYNSIREVVEHTIENPIEINDNTKLPTGKMVFKKNFEKPNKETIKISLSIGHMSKNEIVLITNIYSDVEVGEFGDKIILGYKIINHNNKKKVVNKIIEIIKTLKRRRKQLPTKTNFENYVEELVSDEIFERNYEEESYGSTASEEGSSSAGNSSEESEEF